MVGIRGSLMGIVERVIPAAMVFLMTLTSGASWVSGAGGFGEPQTLPTKDKEESVNEKSGGQPNPTALNNNGLLNNESRPNPLPQSPKALASNDWKPYGWAMPDQEAYNFGLPKNNEKDIVGFAAKGNVIIGDYTASTFQEYVLPKLSPGLESVIQPYVIDPTDASLGYHDYGVDNKNRPRFSGNYNQLDGKLKLDEAPRKFYESTLSDESFKKLIDPTDRMFQKNGAVMVEGVFFTNHALAGYVPVRRLDMQGALVARDESLLFPVGSSFRLNHDIRLLDQKETAPDMMLPVGIKRLKLISWQEVYGSTANNKQSLSSQTNSQR